MIVTCGHCKHWHEYSAHRGVGFCQLIGRLYFGSYPYPEQARSCGTVRTTADFGCTLGEAKEPTGEAE